LSQFFHIWASRKALEGLLPSCILFFVITGNKYQRLVPPRFLYRYQPLHDNYSSLRQMLERARWWFSSRAEFDDEEDMLFPGFNRNNSELSRAALNVQGFMDGTGVLCLSASAKQPLLWELYAGSGRGVCIKLESNYVVHPDHGPFKVHYSDEPKPLWNPFGGNRNPTSYLLRKKRRWSYQAEWRCILKWNDDEKPTVGYRPLFSKRALAGLIFGWNTSREDRLKVLSWLRGGRWLRRLGLPEPMGLSLQAARLIGGSIELSDCDPRKNASSDPAVFSSNL
jgi:hypothetical protein